METALSWTSTNANHLQSPYSFAQKESPYMKLSFQPLLEHSQFTIPLTPYHLPSSFNESLAILSFQVMIQRTKQPKKPPPLPQTQFFLFLFFSFIQVINELIRDALPTHEPVALIYQHRRISRDLKHINNRKDGVLLERLRSGHHPSLRQYLNPLDPSQDPVCPNCRLEVQDLPQWLCECPATITIRQRVFGNHQGSLEWLATRPGYVVAFARKTLVNLDA